MLSFGVKELSGASQSYVETRFKELIEKYISVATPALVVATADYGEAHWEHYQFYSKFHQDSRVFEIFQKLPRKSK